MRLIFVTGNAGKLREARLLLEGIARVDQDQSGYQEIQVDTLEEVASFGLEEIGKRLDPPFFLDDSGLFVHGLQGFPGVFSAYAYKTIGCDGIRALLDAAPTSDRSAEFRAIVAYRDVAGNDHLFLGTCSGHIATEPRGSSGFGFDPIFIPDAGDGRTLAEMSPDEKGILSHRGHAMRAFRNHLSPD